MTAGELSLPASRPFLGRAFFSPVVDSLLICGGISIPLLLLGDVFPGLSNLDNGSKLVLFILVNYAHFAASTVRLYTKPGTAAAHPMVAWGLPLVFLGGVAAAIASPELVGRNVTALYLSWSPYHYAAQAYGLALMYCYRSQVQLSADEKRALWWICMLPFIRAMVNLKDESITDIMGVQGIRWLLPEALLDDGGPLSVVLQVLVAVLGPLAFLLPCWFAFAGKRRLPLLALCLVLTNAFWLVAFSYFDAAIWATVAHSIQYLCIVTFVHAKDFSHSARSSRGPAYHTATFYLLSLIVGVVLFLVIPPVTRLVAGLLDYAVDPLHSFLMVVVAINLHHFIVDGYIWRSKRAAPRVAAAV